MTQTANLSMQNHLENLMNVIQENEYFQTVSEDLKKSNTDVMTLAFKAGVKQLWREYILRLYMDGQITREEGIEIAGDEWEDMANRASKHLYNCRP